jgi:hypothetical protein
MQPSKEVPGQKPDPQAPQEENMLIGSCDGVSFIPAHEHDEYLKGYRQMTLWAAAILSPVVLLVLLIYFG